MPTPSLPELIAKLAAKAEEMYGSMEHYRLDGMGIANTANKLTSALTFGYVQPLSIKTTKFAALAKAENDDQRREVLKVLKNDKEVLESHSLKNIVAIFEHAFEASLGHYVEGTENAAKEKATPVEAAAEAIESLTPTYDQQFTKVPNKAEFLHLVDQVLRARLKVEKQQALAAAEQQKQQAIETARNEERLQKHRAVAEANAQALLARKLALNSANKAALSAKETAVDAQHEEAIEAIDKLEREHRAALDAAHHDAAIEQERLYVLNTQTQQARDEEIARNKQLTQQLENLQRERQQLIEHANSAHQEILLAQDSLQEQEQALKQLASSLGSAAAEINAKTNRIDAAKEEIARLNHELATTFGENQRFHDEITTLQQRTAHLESRLGMTVEELRCAKTERDRFLDKIKQHSYVNRKQEQSLVDANRLTMTLAREVKETQAENALLQTKLANAKREHAESYREIATLKATNSQLSSQAELLETEIQTQAAMLALAKEQREETATRMHNSDFAAELRTEQASHQDTKARLSNAEAHVLHLEAEQHSMKGTYQNELEKNRQLRQQLDSMRLAHSANNSHAHSIYHQANKKHQNQHQNQHQNHNQQPQHQARFGHK